uniref:Uncharacterized protein n=1 Tax=Arundo donax TaxID=35708 RepID=A0A0A9BEE4_ARUDO
MISQIGESNGHKRILGSKQSCTCR